MCALVLHVHVVPYQVSLGQATLLAAGRCRRRQLQKVQRSYTLPSGAGPTGCRRITVALHLTLSFTPIRA